MRQQRQLISRQPEHADLEPRATAAQRSRSRVQILIVVLGGRKSNAGLEAWRKTIKARLNFGLCSFVDMRPTSEDYLC